MPLSDISPQIAAVIGAALTLVASLVLPRHRQGWCAGLATATLAVAAVLQWGLLDRGAGLTFHGLWARDGATAWAGLLIFAATAVVVLLSPRWLATDPRHGEWYALLLLAAVGATIMAAATDLNELVVGLLLSSITGYVLAAYHRSDPASVEAGMRFFLIGGLTNSLLLVGVVLLYGAGGTTLYAPLAEQLGAADPVVLVAAVSLVALGLAFEIGAVPAHAWLPDVAEGAPAPAAAFLTVVPKIGALVALARLMDVVPETVVAWRPLVAVLAAATMTLGNLSALWQDDVRRLLGWSSVSQAGYALMAVVVVGRSDLAVPALVAFLAAYTAGNLAAFAVVVQLRGRTALEDYAGLGSRRPWLAAGLVLAMLSLVGIPPLAGFVGKLTLFTATVEAGYAWLALLAVVNTVISLVYYLRVAAAMYFGDAASEVGVLGWAPAVGVGVTVTVTAVGGLLAGPVLEQLAGVRMLP